MALRRPIQTILFFPLISKSKASISSHLNSTTHCLKTRNFSVNATDFSSNIHNNDLVEELLTIFTTNKSPLIPLESEELRTLGARLTPETVETVLKSFKSWRVAHQFFSWAAEQDGYKHSCYTYNAIARILSEARKVPQLRILAVDLVNSRCPITPGALGFLIRCLGSQGLVEEAINLFDQVKRLRLCVLNNYSYNCLLEAIAKSAIGGDGMVELVEMRLKEMREDGWYPDKFTLTPVLQAYCNAKRFEEAQSVFHQIFDRGWADEHVFTILVISFCKWGEVDKAFELIERMEDHNISVNEKTLCSLIHGFTKELRVDQALQLFDKMRKLGFKPDLRLYSVLIEGLCKKKEFDKALDLYSEMKSAGISPDANLVTNVISSFCAEGDWVSANKFLQEGQEMLDGEALVLLYNGVLDGLVNYGLVEKAYLLLRANMGTTECPSEAQVDNLFLLKENVLPNSVSFNIVIDGLCKKDKLDEALNLFHAMIQVGCKGNTILYNNLINELCNSNRLDEGFILLKKMKESGVEPTHFTHNCIFGCLCRNGNVCGALDLIREMRVHGHQPWIKHYSLLVKHLCIHGKALEACNFLTDMAEEGFRPDIVAYSAAIDGLFKIQEVDHAIKLFHEIFRRGHCPDVVAYNIMIRGLLKVGRVSDAQDYVNEMLMKGLLPSVVTYNLLINGFCKANQLDQALLCFKRMVEEAREPTVITYTTLIDGLCNAGRPDGALTLWHEMGDKGCTPNRIAYMALVHGLCKCGRPDTAQLYFHEMREKEMRPDTYAYMALISGFLSKGDSIMSLEILKEMVGKDEFPDPSDKLYPILRDALRKLSEDATTSSDLRNLIAEGCIPEIFSVTPKVEAPVR